MNSSAISIGHASESRVNNFHLIRLTAALLVIYGHSYAISGNPGKDLIREALGIRFAGSFAVDVFFVISGYLITSSIERSSFTRYLWARFLRIFPALWLCALLTVFVLGPILTTDPSYWTDPQTWRYLFKTTTFTGGQSILPGVFSGNPRPSVNGSLWTLNVEVRLYLLIFLLGVFGLIRGNRRLSWLVIFAFLIGFFYIPTFWPFGYLTKSDRWIMPISCFLAGSFVWKNRYDIKLSYPLLAALLAIAGMLYKSPGFEVAYFLLMVYGVFFVAYVPKLPMIKQRDLSYGVYIYGWPIQQTIEVVRPNSTAMFNMVWAMGLSLLMGYLSWELVEKRALSLKGLVKSTGW